MELIFDTSVLIEIQKGNDLIINKIKLLRETYPSQPRMSFIVYFEFLHGLRDKNKETRENLIEFIDSFDFLQITKKTAHLLSELKSKYELPLADLLIASQTIENNCTLITLDKDFNIIKEIKCILL